MAGPRRHRAAAEQTLAPLPRPLLKSLAMADEAIRVPLTSEWVSPILNVVPLQLFAYEIGLLKGCDIDKPRNLAKSVTVE